MSVEIVTRSKTRKFGTILNPNTIEIPIEDKRVERKVKRLRREIKAPHGGDENSLASTLTPITKSNTTVLEKIEKFVEVKKIVISTEEQGLSGAPDENSFASTLTSIDTKSNTTVLENIEKFVEVKKIVISTEEQGLSGAPEGDLYDIKVLSDKELQSFSPFEDSTVCEILDNAHETAIGLTSSWANKCSYIEAVRRVAIHHSHCIDSTRYNCAVNVIIGTLCSLRSSEVRTGIACFNNIKSLGFFHSLDDGTFQNIFSALINKTVNGPKFVCDLATEAVRSAVLLMEATAAINILSPLTNHKSPEANAKVVMILCELIPAINGRSAVDEATMDEYIRALSIGLNSKKAYCKDRCRAALMELRCKTYQHDESSFQADVRRALEAGKAEEILRETSKAAEIICPTGASATVINKSVVKVGTKSLFVTGKSLLPVNEASLESTSTDGARLKSSSEFPLKTSRPLPSSSVGPHSKGGLAVVGIAQRPSIREQMMLMKKQAMMTSSQQAESDGDLSANAPALLRTSISAPVGDCEESVSSCMACSFGV